MSTEPASSRYVSDYLHTWYIRLYLPLPLPPPLGSIADRIDSMIDERRFSRKEREGKLISKMIIKFARPAIGSAMFFHQFLLHQFLRCSLCSLDEPFSHASH